MDKGLRLTADLSSFRRMPLIRWLTCLAAAVVLAGCTHASGPVRPMLMLGYAFAPPAFEDFCRREKSLCDSQHGRKLVSLTSSLERELKAVNVSTNRRITQREDLRTVGREDQWDLPVRQGDCEDFAIFKKAELIRRGWPAASLLLTVVRHRFSDEGHTVLTVRTSKGDLILDSLNNTVTDWSATPYRYFARQSQDVTGEWERIGRSKSGRL